MHAQPVVGPRRERQRDAAVDRHRQHEAVVVIGMLADEIDASRRVGDARRVVVEDLPEPGARLIGDHGRSLQLLTPNV